MHRAEGRTLPVGLRLKPVELAWVLDHCDASLCFAPEVLAEPYTSTTSYRHLEEELREYVCLENNHDSADAKGRPGIRLE